MKHIKTLAHYLFSTAIRVAQDNPRFFSWLTLTIGRWPSLFNGLLDIAQALGVVTMPETSRNLLPPAKSVEELNPSAKSIYEQLRCGHAETN